MFDDLRDRRLVAVPDDDPVWLEQKHIGFDWVQRALAALPPLHAPVRSEA